MSHSHSYIVIKHYLHSNRKKYTVQVFPCVKQYTHMLATYCKESEDDHTCAHHVGISILEGRQNQKLHQKSRWMDVSKLGRNHCNSPLEVPSISLREPPKGLIE